MSQRVRIETKSIIDWDSFHSVFAETMGFPDFYGRNMDAWIDCMAYIDTAQYGMNRVTVPPAGHLELEIGDADDLQRRLPEIFQALVDCTAFVNERKAVEGLPPVISLILC
ncbi:MAG: barstar family protein [Pirellulaceae bacterium]|nr:barstar family protein [Pirellulaceae bacterium]